MFWQQRMKQEQPISRDREKREKAGGCQMLTGGEISPDLKGVRLQLTTELQVLSSEAWKVQEKRKQDISATV